MKVNGIQLNNFQANFVKEFMGDVFMPDTRAEATFNKLCAKYDVDVPAILDAVNVNFAKKNTEFKKLQTQVEA